MHCYSSAKSPNLYDTETGYEELSPVITEGVICKLQTQESWGVSFSLSSKIWELGEAEVSIQARPADLRTRNEKMLWLK